MQFIRATENSEGYIPLWESEKGIWCIVLSQKLFGRRVTILHRLQHDTDLVFEYCAGADERWQLVISAVLKKLLSRFDEDVSAKNVVAALPPYRVKPMMHDPICWQLLCESAHLPTLWKQFPAELETDYYLDFYYPELRNDPKWNHIPRPKSFMR